MEPKNKDTKEEEKNSAAEEYEAAWEEMGEPSSEVPGLTGEEKEDPDPELAPEPEIEKPAPIIEPPAEDAREKALKDTKAWATKLAMENSDLKKKIAEFEKGNATYQDVEDARRAVKDAQGNLEEIKQKVYEDYPEQKALLDPMLEKISTLENRVKEFDEFQEKSKAQEEKATFKDWFEKEVKPEVLKNHPDFDAIVADDAYWAWSAQQRPALKMAANDSNDPADISWALDEFKKFKHSGETASLKDKEATRRTQTIKGAQTLRGGKTPFPAGKDDSSQDYDSAWDDPKLAAAAEGRR